MNKYTFCYIVAIFAFFYSCKDKRVSEKEYYSNGTVKKETLYSDPHRLSKEVKSYYSNGILSKECNYINDKLNGDFISYNELGQILSKGYFKDGVPIGPTYYFNKGGLVLYNERDFNNKVYYVKKFDSTSHLLIKEEGVCLSPNTVIKQSISIQELYFFYAQPEGYTKDLKVEIDGQSIEFDTLQGHMGIIKLKLPAAIGKVVKIFSTLKYGTNIICQDSIQQFIVNRN